MTIYRSHGLRIVAATMFLLSAIHGASAAECPVPADSPAARVTDAYRVEVSPTAKHDNGVRLDDEVVVEIENLATLLHRQACSASKKPIVLYLDGRPLAGAVAHPPSDPAQGKMIFPLVRTEETQAVWLHLLQKPELKVRKVAVSVGIEDEFAIESGKFLALDVISNVLAFWLVLAVLALLVAFWALTIKTGLLRDPTSPQSAVNQKSWSLSRVQAAWWFFIILMSYVFIGIVTGDFSTTITGTTLVLLGIAAGTSLTSAVVDHAKDTPANQAISAAAEARVAGEVQAMAVAAAAAPLNQTAQETMEAKQSQLMKLRGRNEQFFIDILSDANGVSIHRFQIVVWTIVLGGVFVWSVYRDLAMPQFSNTLLGLMGLSAGTFVAMKGAEPVTPKP